MADLFRHFLRAIGHHLRAIGHLRVIENYFLRFLLFVHSACYGLVHSP